MVFVVNFGEFSAIITSNISFLSSPSHILIMHIYIFCNCPIVLEYSAPPFSLFFLLTFQSGKFLLTYFQAH